MATARHIAIPDAKPAFERIDDRLCQKVSPRYDHARLQGKLFVALSTWADAGGLRAGRARSGTSSSTIPNRDGTSSFPMSLSCRTSDCRRARMRQRKCRMSRRTLRWRSYHRAIGVRRSIARRPSTSQRARGLSLRSIRKRKASGHGGSAWIDYIGSAMFSSTRRCPGSGSSSPRSSTSLRLGAVPRVRS